MQEVTFRLAKDGLRWGISKPFGLFIKNKEIAVKVVCFGVISLIGWSGLILYDSFSEFTNAPSPKRGSR